MVQEAFTARAEAFIRTNAKPLLTSDLAGTELASAISRLVRMRELTKTEAAGIFKKFDRWRDQVIRPMSLATSDILYAETYLRRLDLNLRAPDAMHLAMAGRAGAMLVTFDTKMNASALALGLEVADI
jgi:predicted nucleic acid-binding protein